MTQKNDKQFEVCTLCRRILVQLFEKHIAQCQEKEGKYDNKRVHETKPPVFDVNADKVTRLATFLPKPPRNCKVAETGATFIRWVWEEPVSDGGLPVYEYELAFTEKFMEMNKKTRRYVTTVTEVEHHTTSLWCAKDPICHAGCKITGLKGNTEYNNFRIRAKNLRGWSEWAQMMEHEDHGLDEGEEEADEDKTTPTAPVTPRGRRTWSRSPPCSSPHPGHVQLHTPGLGRRLLRRLSLIDFIIYYTVNEVCTTTERDVVSPSTRSSAKASRPAWYCETSRQTPSSARCGSKPKVGLLSEAQNLGLQRRTMTHGPSPPRATCYAPGVRPLHEQQGAVLDTSFFTGTQQRLLEWTTCESWRGAEDGQARRVGAAGGKEGGRRRSAGPTRRIIAAENATTTLRG